MKWTIKKIIDDTVQFFGADPENNRCMDDGGVCMYTNDQGKHCAIGRFLIPEYQSLEFAIDHLSDNVGNLDMSFELEYILVPKVRGLPLRFWDDLQILHDEGKNWDGTGGLSDRGEDFYHEMILTYVGGEI